MKDQMDRSNKLHNANIGESITIGRSSICDLAINDKTVSRQHSKIISDGNRTVIYDLDSKHGTHINGIKKKSSRLKDGDSVRIGNSYLVYTEGNVQVIKRDAYLKRVRQRISQRYGLPIILMMVAMFATVHYIENTSSEASSFEAPKNLESLIESTREKVFSVSCDNSQGTAWPLQLVEQTVLVTNVHVIKECVASAGNIHVENPISRIQVRALGIDENADIAVLENPFDVQGFSIQQSVSIGTWVMAIGNPLGLDRSVNFGEISNVEKRQIIFDTSINPGNSGGPLLNSSGEVIAIVTAIVSEAQGMAVGIPIREICDSLIACSNGGLRLG